MSTIFDDIASEAPGKKQGDVTPTDNTNAAGQNQLLAGLLKAAQEAPSTDESTDEVDYSALFATAETKTAPNTQTPTQPTPNQQQQQQQTKTQPESGDVAPTPAFIAQINDDKIVDQLVEGIGLPEVQLPAGMQEALDAGEEVEMNAKNIQAIMQQGARVAQQQSLNQVVGLVRELIPALIEQAQHAAAKNVTSKQNRTKVQQELSNNPDLARLVDTLTAGKEVQDPELVVKQAKQLMASINKNQLATVKRPESQDRSRETFLSSM